MKTRRAFISLALLAAAAGVTGSPAPAAAQCDPGPTAAIDSSPHARSGCANSCDDLAAAGRKLTKRDLFHCTQ